MSDILKLDQKALRELQLAELDGLVFFDKYCRSHGLTYYLCGGCLIGAVRHKGFIPWDDDTDVLMPRPDYERFLELYKKEKPSDRFLLLDDDEEHFYGNIFATLTDTDHTMVKDYQEHLDMPHGVPLDIFPIDGLAEGKIARYIQYIWTMIYSLFRSQTVPKNHGGLLSLGSKLLLKIFKKHKTRVRIWKYAEKKMSGYNFDEAQNVAEFCAGYYFMKKVYPRSIYKDVCELDFEGKRFFAMGDYDAYLKIPFGNYMELPPQEERLPHHEIVKLELNTPCR